MCTADYFALHFRILPPVSTRTRIAMNFPKKTPLLAILAGSLVIGVVFADKPSDESSSNSSDTDLTLVDVVRVSPTESHTETRRFSGLIESRRNSQLSFDRIGRIEKVLVDEGDSVEKGEVLAQIGTNKLNAQRAQLIADKTVRQAELAELLAGPRDEKVAAAKARLQKAKKQLDQASRNLQRRQQLIRQNLVSRESAETARTQVDAANADYNSLEQELLELENGTRKEQIEAKRAQVDAIDAAIEVVDADLDNSRIEAPYSGLIVARELDEGTIVAPGETVLELAENTYLQARFGIPSMSGKQIVVGQPVQIDVGDQMLKGAVQSFVSRIAKSTRTQTVLVKFTDPDGVAYDGQVASLRLNEELKLDGFKLPRSALTRGTRGLWNCYVARPDESEHYIVERRIVQVVRVLGDQVIVKGDVNTGDFVVAAATHRVTASQRVRIGDTKNASPIMKESKVEASQMKSPRSSGKDQ